MRKNRKFVSAVAVTLAVLMVLTILLSVISSLSASAKSQAELQSEIANAESTLVNLETNQREVAAQQAELQVQIQALEKAEATVSEEKALLEEKVELLREEINNIKDQIAVYEELIREKEEQLNLAEVKEAEQYQLYVERIRALEEDGSLSYFEVLLTSRSFSNLLERISDVNEIMDYDQQVADQLEAARVAVQEAKADLEKTKAKLDKKIVELEANELELAKQIGQAEEKISQLEQEIAVNDEAYTALEAAYEATGQEIAQMTQNLDDLDEALMEEIARLEKAAREAAANAANTGSSASGGSTGGSSASGGSAGGGYSSGAAAGTGMFIWPSPTSKTVTSVFGNRIHPISGVLKNHNGIDISASANTAVLASAGGVVTTSVYNSGYGNYIIVNHGNGYATLYAHMNQRYVSVGSTVYQGQTIGLVGSTGYSTGPHIHFEVFHNGTRADPLSFFTGYTYG